MLKKIVLKNYTTFIHEATFDFSASRYDFLDKSNVKNGILKGALFVGENASGKTFALKSVKLLLDILIGNYEINFNDYKSLYTKGNKYSIKYVFSFDGVDVQYEIGFNSDKIDYEELFLNETRVINRKGSKGEAFNKSVENINPTLPLVKQEYYNTRFNNDIILNKWFEFLKNSMYMNCLSREFTIYNADSTTNVLISERNIKRINKFFKDIGYTSEVSIDEANKTIQFRKQDTDVVLSMDKESLGNQVLIGLAIPLLYCTSHDCIFIADEFSSGLHNALEETLIKYFFKKSKNSQIFFTSHSTNLLDTALLRPDQVYSFLFDSKYGTRVKRFSDENPRESQNIEKMYLSGVFDGLPKYEQNFKNK